MKFLVPLQLAGHKEFDILPFLVKCVTQIYTLWRDSAMKNLSKIHNDGMMCS